MYATVVLDISTKQLNRLFDYKIPLDLIKEIEVGMRVVVDFNNRKRLAYVVKISKTSKHATKEILYSLDSSPTLTKTQLKLINFLQQKAFSSYIKAFKTAIPQGLHGRYEYQIKVVKPEMLKTGFEKYVQNGLIDLNAILEKDFKELNRLLKTGVLEKQTIIKERYKTTYTRELFLKNVNYKLTLKQQQIVAALTTPKLEKELLDAGYSKNIIDRLITRGVIGFKKVTDYYLASQKFKLEEEVLKLTAEQQKAVETVSFKEPKRYLLFGPPASGKTEVYLRLIEKALQAKLQTLVLVPEIALVPQMVARIKDRFSVAVATYHSDLTGRQKRDTYLKIKKEEIPIVVGTRSAIFLPLEKLGLIVLDEAHDLSYIQKTAPYYDAKEIAYLLADLKKCPVIFGTATPSVVMYYNLKVGKMKLLKLSEPIIKQNLEIKLIDMKKEFISSNLSMFSRELKRAIVHSLNNKEQIIILVNRRGYAPFTLCRNCGFVHRCPTCQLSLVYHKKTNRLVCHHCGYNISYSSSCPVCKQTKIKPVGFGTEQVQEALEAEFENIRVIRMDQDTTGEKGSHDQILTAFYNYEADVLLGTQMISKGHHFERVGLVAVLLAEQMLRLSSYLANEKAYNLISQHIGRLRKEAGLALIQSYEPNHFVLKSIVESDFELYYQEELKVRRALKLEPFYNVIKITFKGKEANKTYNLLNNIKRNIIAKNSQIAALGPTESYIFYSNKRYHYNLTLSVPKQFKIASLMNYFDLKYTKEYLIEIDYYPDQI
ncbi:MAG: primosomal protein N' [Acholeplasmataceae bacterium]|nr:primosomal protein N' [Acholeplasmataceae bacterium]